MYTPLYIVLSGEVHEKTAVSGYGHVVYVKENASLTIRILSSCAKKCFLFSFSITSTITSSKILLDLSTRVDVPVSY